MEKFASKSQEKRIRTQRGESLLHAVQNRKVMPAAGKPSVPVEKIEHAARELFAEAKAKEGPKPMLHFDITDLKTTMKGQKAINALLACQAVLFRTARGRNAMSVRKDVFEKLESQLFVDREEGQDGLIVLVPKKPAQEAVAA